MRRSTRETSSRHPGQSRNSAAISSVASSAGRFVVTEPSSSSITRAHRQNVGRTVISTVPTLLQRQGVFTEAIGGPGSCPVRPWHDDALKAPRCDRHSPETRFRQNGSIPWRARSSAATRCRQPPGPPTTIRRVATSPSIRTSSTSASIIAPQRLEIRCSVVFHTSTNDSFRSRLSRTGVARQSGTLGPAAHEAWSFASSYQRIFSDRLLNELRVGDTRRARRHARRRSSPVGVGLLWAFRGFRPTASFQPRCRRSRSAATSSSARLRIQRRISAPA